MQPTSVTLPYDEHAELALARVGLLRAGVPVRILDQELPLTKKRRSGPGAQ